MAARLIVGLAGGDVVAPLARHLNKSTVLRLAEPIREHIGELESWQSGSLVEPVAGCRDVWRLG